MPNIRMDIAHIYGYLRKNYSYQNDSHDVAEIAAFFVCLFNKNTLANMNFFFFFFILLEEEHLEIKQFRPSLTLHIIDSWADQRIMLMKSTGCQGDFSACSLLLIKKTNQSKMAESTEVNFDQAEKQSNFLEMVVDVLAS